MKIDKDLHISFDFENQEGESGCVYIDYIDKRRFDSIAKALGQVYTGIRSGEIHPDVFAVDWPILLKDHNLEPFLEHTLSTAEIIINERLISFAQPKKKLQEQLIKQGIDEEVLNVIKGLILFISALLRYTTAKSLMSVKGLFTTYQNVQEWRSSHTHSIENSEENPESIEKL